MTLDTRQPPIRVYKVGGSLLSSADLGPRLDSLLAADQDRRPLLVVGGGPVANVVRDWDRVHRLGEDLGHDLAFRGMELTARLLASQLKTAAVVYSRGAAQQCWEGASVPVLNAYRFFASPAAEFELPMTWQTTSDSIAARVASVWPADELCLLKRVDPPASLRLRDAVQQGSVDAVFPHAIAGVSQVAWCNMERGIERTLLR